MLRNNTQMQQKQSHVTGTQYLHEELVQHQQIEKVFNVPKRKRERLEKERD